MKVIFSCFNKILLCTVLLSISFMNKIESQICPPILATLESNSDYFCFDDEGFGGIDFTAGGGTMYEFFVDANGDDIADPSEVVQAQSTLNTISLNPSWVPLTPGLHELHVVVTDAGGCIGVASVTFTASEYPDPGTLTSFEACEGFIDLDDLLSQGVFISGGEWRVISTTNGITTSSLDANNATNFPAGSYLVNYGFTTSIGCGTSIDHPLTVKNCVPVPTLGEWGIICLGLLLLIFGVTAIKAGDYLSISKS